MMENVITKSSYVRTLTKKEYEAVANNNIKEIKRITGIDRDFMFGDSMIIFGDKPIKWGLYKVNRKDEKTIYYIVQSVFTRDRAFCYSVS